MLKFLLGCAIQVEGHARHHAALVARLMCSTVPWVCGFRERHQSWCERGASEEGRCCFPREARPVGTGVIRGWLKGLETWHSLGSVILKLWEGKVGEMEPRYCPPKPHFLFSPPSILSHWSLTRGTRTPEIEGLVLNH